MKYALTPQSADGRSDGELLGLLRAGDTEALEAIVRRHRDAAVRVARCLVDHHSAEDVVSESFSRLWAAVRRGGGPVDVVRPYLIRVVRSCAVDLFRRRQDVPVDLDLQPHGQVADHGDAVADALLVQRALAELPERWKSVLWLYYVDDVDRNEIAVQLGILPTAVSQLLARARAGFRKVYLQQADAAAAAGCTETRNLLPDYVDGRAKPAQRAVVERHLDGCESCGSVAFRLTQFARNAGAVVALAMVGGAGISLVRGAGVAAAAAAISGHGAGAAVLKIGAAVASIAAVGAVATLVVIRGGGPAGPEAAATLPTMTVSASTQTEPSASASAVPTPTPATTTAGGPGPGEPDSGGADASAIVIGPATAVPRSSDRFPLHLAVPAVAPAQGPLVLDLSFSRPVAFRVHQDGAHSAWQCATADGSARSRLVTCAVTPYSPVTLLGIDLDYQGEQAVSLTLTGGRSGSSPGQARSDVALPTIG